MTLTKNIKKAIKDHALKQEPNECCGLLYEKEGQIEAKACENISADTSRHFVINPRDYLYTSSLGKIKATYHSHTNKAEEFSATDKLNSKRHKIDYVLYNTNFNTFRLYSHKKSSVSFLDEEFTWGKHDCISLVQDYLKEEANVDFKLSKLLKERTSDWPKWHWDTKGSLPGRALAETLELNLKKGFKRIKINSVDDITKNDVICFLLRKNETQLPYDHFAICTGEREMFHHINGGYPVSQNITNFYFKRIANVYRYTK